MYLGKKSFVVVVALTLILLLAGGPGAAATPLAAPPTQETAPSAGAWPYAGQLQTAAGQPVTDGAYDFQFSLYDALQDGSLLWSETQAGLRVQGGSFSASLGSAIELPKEVRERKEIWLEVGVRGPGEADFTPLSPRQRLMADASAAAAALTCPHNHFGDSWPGSSSPYYGLQITQNGGGDGLRVYSKSTTFNYAAVYAVNEATSGNGSAMYAYSANGLGLYARSGQGDGIDVSTDSTTGKSALYAHSTTGNAVWGYSTSKVAIHGASSSGRGVEGFSGTTHAGYFESSAFAGAYIKTAQPATWYAAVVDGGLHAINGGCVGCAVVYIGQNGGEAAIQPGDLVAAAGVNVSAATGEPILLVRLASRSDDPVIGVAVAAAPDPADSSQAGAKTPTEGATGAIPAGRFLTILVSGLGQVRVAGAPVQIGDHLLPDATGAVAVQSAAESMVRVLSEPDETGLVWAMVNAR